MAYVKNPTWQSGVAGGTKITPAKLNHQEDGIEAAAAAADAALTLAGSAPTGYINGAAQFGMIGDDSTDNSTAFASALAAASGKTLYLPKGTYRVASSTRLLMSTTSTSIVGDPTGVGTVLKFTHVSGGLDIGDGTNITYENRLRNITLVGNATATQLVRMRKAYEPYFENVRLESANGPLLTLDECGQFDADRFYLGSSTIGMRFTGATTPPIANIRLANLYSLTTGFEVQSANLGRLYVTDSWIEAVTNVVDLNRSGGVISIGELVVDARMVNATTAFRLLRWVAFTTLNTQRVRFSGYVDAASATTPALDLTAQANNSGDFRAELKDLYYQSATSGALIQAHTSQDWWRVIVSADVRNASGVIPPASIFESPLATGGVWHQPSNLLTGVGSPESVVAAPPGYIYTASDIGRAYVKRTGLGNTGWVEL